MDSLQGETNSSQQLLQKQLELQQILIDISSKYINMNLDDLEKNVLLSLEQLGHFVEADRAYIFEYNFVDYTASNTYEWCAEGITPEIDNLQGMPMEYIPHWVEKHQKREIFGVPEIDELPEGPLKDILLPQGIKTLITFPMLYNQELLGFVGFDWVKEVHQYSETELKLLLVYAEMLVNIKKRSQLEVNLIKAKEEAEAANKSKSEFLANMSHEIRTPLNGVIGFTDLLINTSLTYEQRQYVQSANSSAHILLGIINDILDFSKIEAGKLELEEVEIDLLDLVEETADIVKYNTNKKNIEFLLNIQVDLPRFIYVDPIRLKQILVNLLSNAIKFTEQGEVELSVSFEQTDPENKEGIFTFTIRDTGIGISEAQQEKLFKSFSQADSSTTRKFGGTGLGLVISQMLAEKMGSSIQLSSEFGKGSIFSISLTKSYQDLLPMEKREFDSLKKILILDDNQNNRNILENILKHWNIGTTSVENGIAALTLLAGNQDFDVMIVDYHMPYMDGLSTIREINRFFHEHPDRKKPKTILYSSADDDTIEMQVKELKIDALLLKPAKISELFHTLNNLSRKPLEDVVGDQAAQTSIPNPPENDNKIRILIAEDVPLNMLLVKTIVKNHYPEAIIVESQNGQEALNKYHSEHFDLIFMDVQMPLMDGFEATKKIRLHEKTHGGDIPIVALTAGALPTEKEKCMEAGMDHFLTKPIDKVKLAEVMERILKSKR
ncbi:GAF domain-containing hybrid sensor histidine kinase/response regulator [Fontibacter flavus]|uniref:histidine kinase n=1 Tax=Fontibacter flavus TaxID=654838 RepID=A0ABV6FRI4_9BACT